MQIVNSHLFMYINVCRITVRPSIPDSNEVSNHEVIRGDSMDLECPAVGKPLPKITWLRAGQIVGYNSELILSM